MGVIGEAFGGAIDTTIDVILKGIDELVTSDEEREALKKQVIEAQLKNAVDIKELENDYAQNITDRWKADNSSSSSWLAKSIRPIALIFSYVIFSVLAILDSYTGFAFTVPALYIETFRWLLLTITVGYFGSRGIEKVTGIVKGRNVNGIGDDTMDLY